MSEPFLLLDPCSWRYGLGVSNSVCGLASAEVISRDACAPSLVEDLGNSLFAS